jgi:hypothetical protein
MPFDNVLTRECVPLLPATPATTDVSGNARTRREPTQLEPQGRFLGQGRSAEVFAIEGPDGRVAARKVFVGSSLARLVHYVCFGADNPYVWNESAILGAHHRRRVLRHLVRFWFGDKVRVAESYGVGWNERHRVNELTMEFIDGRGAKLRQPFGAAAENEIGALVGDVMRPLQAHLIAAGFDGAAWQAGLYNPVATSNFMAEERADGTKGWVWIDIESGVPALFPANPLGLFRYYLPRAFKYGRPLFDDVDVARLEGYVRERRRDIERAIGPRAFDSLAGSLRDLAASRADWRDMSRLERGIESALRRGTLSRAEADRYIRRPYLWLARQIGHGVAAMGRSIARRARAWLGLARIGRLAVATLRLLGSEKARAELARNTTVAALDRWHSRRQLTTWERNRLVQELDEAGSSAHLSDFGMHFAMKPLVKFATLFALPPLFAAGLIDETALAFGIVAGGSIARTIYTLWRLGEAVIAGTPRPWLALLVGLPPMVGTVAFPIQLLYDGAGRGISIAKFIVLHVATRMGEAIPIWGGRDTLAEHLCNRAAASVLLKRRL